MYVAAGFCAVGVGIARMPVRAAEKGGEPSLAAKS